MYNIANIGGKLSHSRAPLTSSSAGDGHTSMVSLPRGIMNLPVTMVELRQDIR